MGGKLVKRGTAVLLTIILAYMAIIVQGGGSSGNIRQAFAASGIVFGNTYYGTISTANGQNQYEMVVHEAGSIHLSITNYMANMWVNIYNTENKKVWDKRYISGVSAEYDVDLTAGTYYIRFGGHNCTGNYQFRFGEATEVPTQQPWPVPTSTPKPDQTQTPVWTPSPKPSYAPSPSWTAAPDESEEPDFAAGFIMRIEGNRLYVDLTSEAGWSLLQGYVQFQPDAVHITNWGATDMFQQNLDNTMNHGNAAVNVNGDQLLFAGVFVPPMHYAGPAFYIEFEPEKKYGVCFI